MEGDRKKKRHGCHGAKARQNPDQCSDEDSDEAIEEVHRLESHRKTQVEIV
jgi:hypothetical protein